MTLRPLTRRSMLAATGLLAVQGAAGKASADTRARPNFLWLVSEDNAPLIGAYGDPLARTPNIDALAKRGILYKNAYCPAPVCAPTRFTILTGVQSQSCAPANHMRARCSGRHSADLPGADAQSRVLLHQQCQDRL